MSLTQMHPEKCPRSKGGHPRKVFERSVTQPFGTDN
jgi:hypothetical protein